MPPPVTIDDIRAAARRLEGVAARTPLLRSDALDAATQARVLVKAESLQRFGAFKLRGAYNKIASLAPQERARGVLAYSSGNHAIGVAASARMFGAPAVIVMPVDAPRAKVDATRAQGAEIVLYDLLTQSREQIGEALARERGLALVKPFDDPLVIAGQGTVGLEIGADVAPDIVVVPASGAGLACGIALALPQARVFAVEPEGHDDIARSLAAEAIQSNAPGVRSMCDALLVERMGAITFAIAREHLAGAVSVADDAVRRAMRFAFEHLKLVLEPSGAIALAAALEGAVDLAGKTVVVIASGGNVDAETFAEAIREA